VSLKLNDDDDGGGDTYYPYQRSASLSIINICLSLHKHIAQFRLLTKWTVDPCLFRCCLKRNGRAWYL